MATKSIAVVTNTVTADDTASPSTVVLRDPSGNIAVKNASVANLAIAGTHAGTVIAQAASFTAGAATDYICDCTAAAITVTLPLASASTGVSYNFVKVDSVTGHALNFSGVSGVTSITAQWSKVRIFSDGTNWYSV